MKKLFVFLTYLLAFNIYAQNYVRVEGRGTNLEAAKENAFREAIQLTVGTIVLSQRLSTIQGIKKDNISVFSAGYIDDFKIINISHKTNEVVVLLDVLVAESRMFNQVLSSGNSNEPIDGQRLHGTVNSYLNQRNQADNMLSELMTTYPNNAYILKTKPYTVYIDNNRNTILSIPFKLSWNYDFIVSFNEAMKKLNDANFSFYQSAPGNVYVLAKNPKDYIIGEKTHFKFKDTVFLEKLKRHIESNELRLQLVLRDNNYNTIYQNCFIPLSIRGHKTPFYNVTNPKQFVIFGNEKEETELQLNVPGDKLHLLKQFSHLELLPVSNKRCDN